MRLWLCALLLGAGCGGGVDGDIEDEITIDQGVYGQLIKGCEGCTDQPAANEEVTVYVPGHDDLSVTSDGHGVYEFDLPAGDYTLCTSVCTPITVPYGIIRYDWTSGPGGGYWEPQQ